MSDTEEARRMLAIVYRDLRALRAMVGEIDHFSDEVVGFQAQQAVEKGLKSWLALVVGDYPRVHDLEELLQRLGDSGEKVPERFLGLVDLTDFAVQYRYSAFDDDPGLEREDVLCAVEDFVQYVEALVVSAEAAD